MTARAVFLWCFAFWVAAALIAFALLGATASAGTHAKPLVCPVLHEPLPPRAEHVFPPGVFYLHPVGINYARCLLRGAQA